MFEAYRCVQGSESIQLEIVLQGWWDPPVKGGEIVLLKSLEIQGFKSFPDKITITFDCGLTAVVGPNGSGKSNIADAIRWVMGEQSSKSLRGARMEDVIFTGTKMRRSQGFASVTLVFDNQDRALPLEENQVSIMRKYDRSGESEYRINQKIVRLKDINELLMDTGLGRDGYAIVGQGRIAEIVQSKSDQRREIFEEAAGISKYRYRKIEAERKLALATENLLRLQDILGELQARMTPLKRQSEQAKHFVVLSEQKRTTEISLWADRLTQLNTAMKDQKDNMVAIQIGKQEIDQMTEQKEQQMHQLYQQMQSCLTELDECRRQKEQQQCQISALQAEIAVFSNNILHHEDNRNRTSLQLETFLSSREKYQQEIENKRQEIEQLLEVTQHMEQQTTQSDAALVAINKQVDQILQQEAGLRDKSEQWRAKLSQLKLACAQIDSRMQTKQQQILDSKAILQQTAANQALYQNDLAQVQIQIRTLLEQEESLQRELTKRSKALHLRKNELEQNNNTCNQLQLEIKAYRQKAALLQDLEHNLEGFSYSVKTVLRQGENGALHGIIGTVADLLTVIPKHTVAIETALGGMLQHIVTENEQTAKLAIRYLKQHHAGRATFLPRASVKGNRLDTGIFADDKGFVALACDLVQYDALYDRIVYSLLGRIVVAEDLDCAVTMAKRHGYRFKIVTLDGQVMNPGGSMSGGSMGGKSKGLLSRKTEIKHLSARADDLARQLDETAKQGDTLQRDIQSCSVTIASLERKMAAWQQQKRQAEGDKLRLTHSLSAENDRAQTLEGWLRETAETQQQDQAEQKKLEHTQRQEEQGLQAIQMELNQTQQQREAFTVQKNAAVEKLHQKRLHLLEVQKDLESSKMVLLEMQQRQSSSQQQHQTLLQQHEQFVQDIQQQKQKINTAEHEIERLTEQLAQLDQAVGEWLIQRDTIEQKTTALRLEERQLSDKREKQVAQLARLEEKLLAVQKEYDTLIATLWEEYQLSRNEAQELSNPIQDVRAAQKQLLQLRDNIRALGTVNVAAIEEYREVSGRYEYLSQQLNDIEQTRNGLLEMIDGLTAKMRHIFEQKFHQINQHFAQIFTELFGGGTATLQLNDPDHVLESGVDIFVEPPGKVIKSLSLLSGGEQAFVAIAIYFAILKVRPAPFCVLDEIEANLDDVNVMRYAEYLRTLSGETQFIMITHRRGSMEAADILYGVTMQEEGVSKLLRLEVDALEAMQSIHK